MERLTGVTTVTDLSHKGDFIWFSWPLGKNGRNRRENINIWKADDDKTERDRDNSLWTASCSSDESREWGMMMGKKLWKPLSIACQMKTELKQVSPRMGKVLVTIWWEILQLKSKHLFTVARNSFSCLALYPTVRDEEKISGRMLAVCFHS